MNLYDEQKCIGTAADKAIAARISGFNYNIISNKEKDEIYLNDLRCHHHYVDHENRATQNWWDRRRKYPRDQREPIRVCMQSEEDHPKVEERRKRREEIRLAQIEHPQDFGEWQNRRREFRPQTPPKRYCLNNKKKKKLGYIIATADEWKMRRNQSMPTISARNGNAGTITGRYPRAEQIANESCNLAQVGHANTYRNSMYECPEGETIRQAQKHSSLDRQKNYDFSVTRKNNDFSHENKLTRSDSFYIRPHFAVTNNSVKYDIITNNQRPFLYI